MRLSLSAFVASSSAPSDSGGLSNSVNLLRNTENFAGPNWIKSHASPPGPQVSTNEALDPFGSTQTADEFIGFNEGDAVYQQTSIAATFGGSAIEVAPPPIWQRYSVTGTLNGTKYTFSVYLKDTGAESQVTIQIAAVAGFVRTTITDSAGGCEVMIWGAQLEMSQLATAYTRVA